MRAKGSATAGTMSRRLVTLIHQSPVPHLLDSPPHSLNVVVFHRNVGMLQVNPEANTLGHCLPLFQVAKDALPAAGIKLGNTIFINICLAGKAQLLLHLQFHR